MTWAAHVGMLSGFKIYFNHLPRVVAALQPWAGISQRLRRYYAGLELANAFGVITRGWNLANAFGVITRG